MSAKLLEGKRGLIFGVANQRSIAWGIASTCAAEGAELGFTYLNEAIQKRVVPLAESLGSRLVLPCDVQKPEELDEVFATVEKEWGSIDFLVHSLAYAPTEDLRAPFRETTRDGFRVALEVSCYSLIELARRAKPLMKPGSSLLTLTYYGAVKVVPHYRIMGVAKAALEATVRELAADLGPEGLRVNAISAGPIKTLAATGGISDFRALLAAFEVRAPLRRLVTIEDVGKSGAYLLSDLAAGVTGEVHYVDCGFSVTAA
jgi:enoyl-[acyl-carrier protein] reductase I